MDAEPKKPEDTVPPKLNLKQTGAVPPVDPSAQNVPTKLDLKQTIAGQNAAAMPKKATTRIDMAAAAMIPEEKSKTTRINLGTLGADAGLAPKTIKIQRPSEAATIRLNRPPSAAPAAPPLSQPQLKRQTSRISLQEAFSAQVEGQAPAPQGRAEGESVPAGGPKTIRIKRPGDAIPAPAADAAAAPASPAAEEGPATQRKTIKLRRPGGGEVEGDRLTVTLPKSAADFAAAQAAGASREDEPGPVFGILTLVATLVCATLVYLLCVQALPTLGLSWPGQVPTLP